MMPTSKRSRDPEEAVSAPAPKQAKLEDSFSKLTFMVPIKNRFSPLKDVCDNEVVTLVEDLNTPQTINGNRKVTGDGSPLATGPEIERGECTSWEQLHLIIRTLHCIFERLDGLSSQFCKLQQRIVLPPPKAAQPVAIGDPGRQRYLPSSNKELDN